ncbi:PREDICTED: uncharacterized protein LOC105359398 [Ceratosolen solmsi marchali]|uniref:Uncharacterized protein LOC105359398 n=1 Tax=Ceratosolen solmsi marchali TaxID=326594 RepID=A0AAJ6VKB9_9HYME|nr:PREDICTED: uncharacterized protein LOC105359398 [Ceratosolen solmsi marchali]
MTALTLVMKELPDLDPDEFFNVRAYYCGGKDFRQVLRRARPPSPTNSESSGISSLTSSSTGEDETQTATAKPGIGPRVDCSRETIKTIPQVDIRKQFHYDKSRSNDRILYCGRDILNLERNTQPYKWQLTSPLFCFLNPRVPTKYRSYLRFNGDFLREDYPMETCLKCGFSQPSSFT